MADVEISLSENVEDVIEDIETEVIDELERMPDALKTVLRRVKQDAQRYVKDDAELSGQLRKKIRVGETDFSNTTRLDNTTRLTVGVNGAIVDYAAIVELGSGKRTGETTPKAASEPFPVRDMDRPPKGFPFSTPDIEPKRDDPKFIAMAGYIEDWMRKKGITPEKETYSESAAAITYEIITEGTYAHPFLRPAWFDHEYEVRQLAQNIVRDAAN